MKHAKHCGHLSVRPVRRAIMALAATWGVIFSHQASASIWDVISDWVDSGASFVSAQARVIENIGGKLARGNIDSAVNDFIENAQSGFPYIDPLQGFINQLPAGKLKDTANLANDINKRMNQEMKGIYADTMRNTYRVYKNDFNELARRLQQGDFDVREYAKYSLYYGLATADWSNPQKAMEEIAYNQYAAATWASDHKPGKVGLIKRGAQRAMNDESIRETTELLKKELTQAGIDAGVAGGIIGMFTHKAREERRWMERVCVHHFGEKNITRTPWDVRTGPIEIRNQRWEPAIVAGYSHNDHQIYFYHPLKEHKSNGYWSFVDAGHNDCTFYLRNAKHQGYLGAGEHTADNYVYHYDTRDDARGGKDYLRWELLRVFDPNSEYRVVGYVLRDLKYMQGPVAGASHADGRVYHQNVLPHVWGMTPKERIWSLFDCRDCVDGKADSAREIKP